MPLATIEKCSMLEDDSEITFKKEEMEYFDSNHVDALVVYVRIINTCVKMVMIDTGSSANILCFDTFQKLKLLTNDLTSMTSLLTWFTSYSIFSLRSTSLHVMFRDEPYSKIVIAKFMVVNIPSMYNVIID